MEKDFPSDRHELYRLIRVIGACLFFVAVTIPGFSPPSRPDASTLIVSDDQGRETFFARYLNKNTVRIRGTFRCGDTKPVVIGNDDVVIGGRPTLRKACVVLGARTIHGIAYSDPAP